MTIAAPALWIVHVLCTPVGVDPLALEHSLALELANVRTATTSRVQIEASRCTSISVPLQLRSGSTAHTFEIPLADVAFDARPRAIALIVRERIESAILEQQEALDAPVDPISRPASVELAVALAGAAGYVPRYRRALGGGRAGVELSFIDWLQVVLDAGVYYARAGHPLGDASLICAFVGVAPFFELYADLVQISIGPAIDLGFVSASAESTEPNVEARSRRGFFLLAGAAGRLAITVARAMEVILRIDLDAAVRGFDGRAEEDRLIGLSGFVASASLGLRYDLTSSSSY
jgi:hypothetical protein